VIFTRLKSKCRCQGSSKYPRQPKVPTGAGEIYGLLVSTWEGVSPFTLKAACVFVMILSPTGAPLTGGGR